MTVASGLEVWLLVPSTILPAVAALLIGGTQGALRAARGFSTRSLRSSRR